MMKSTVVAKAVAVLLCAAGLRLFAGDSGWVVAKGYGTDHSSALRSAMRAAVEKYVGVYLDAEAEVRDFNAFESRISTVSNGDIRRYEILRKGVNKDRLYEVVIKAEVEKTAVAGRFKGLIAASSDDVSQLFGQISSSSMRGKDGADLFAAVLKDVDPVRMCTEFRVVQEKTKAVSAPLDDRGRPIASYRRPAGMKLLSLTYSLSYDERKYFRELLPRLQKTLEKVCEGRPTSKYLTLQHPLPEKKTGPHAWNGIETREHEQNLGPDASIRSRMEFVRPFCVTGFPGYQDRGYYRQFFRMKDAAEHVADGLGNLLWVVDEVNLARSQVRITRYQVPDDVYEVYREWLLKLTGVTRQGICSVLGTWKSDTRRAEVEIILKSGDGDMLATVNDVCAAGRFYIPTTGDDGLYFDMNTSYMLKPFFQLPMWNCCDGFAEAGQWSIGWAPAVERTVYVLVPEERLADIAKIDIRFVD